MTANSHHRLDSLSSAARRLAETYREAATWRQCTVLALPLAVFAFAQTPVIWVGAAILLGALFYLRLDLGLRLIVLAIPFAFTYKHVGADIYSPPEILTVVCFLAWAARAIRGLADLPIRRFADLPIRRLHALDWGVLLFVAVAFVSPVIAEDQGAAQWELRILVVEPALVYVMVRGLPAGHARHTRRRLKPTPDTENPLKRVGTRSAAEPVSTGLAYQPPNSFGAHGAIVPLADALTAGALIVAVVGLYQYFFTDYVESVQGVRRILSFYDSPNHVGLFLGRVAPISFCLAAFGATRWRRVYHAAALLPLLLGLYLTYSRGAWLLGLPAALIFIGVMRGRRGRIIARGALIVALLALAPILRTPRIASLLTLESGTNYHRLLLWEGTARMIAANPILGVGLGNFMRHYPRHMLREAGHEPVVFHPHNLLLDTWTSLGLVGVAALAFVLAAFFRAGLRAYRRLHDARELQALTLGLLASMVSFAAHGLVDTGFRLTDLAFVFMLTLGMVGQITARDLPTWSARREDEPGATPRTARPAAGPDDSNPARCAARPRSPHTAGA
jgi:O-antigen ligase